MKRIKCLSRLVTAISLTLAALLFSFSASAEIKLSEPIIAKIPIALVDLDLQPKSLPGQKIEYHHVYSIEYNDLIFNHIELLSFNNSKQFNLALLTQPIINEISGIYKTDILNFYQDPDIRPSKNHKTLKIAMRTYSF